MVIPPSSGGRGPGTGTQGSDSMGRILFSKFSFTGSRFSRKWMSIVIGLVAIMAVACGGSSIAVGGGDTTTSASTGGGSVSIVGDAPNIVGETFNHGDFNLEQIDGPVLINFWFPSCPPCRAELPDLQAAFEEFSPRGVNFIGIQQLGIDTRSEGIEFLEEVGVTYPNLDDKGLKVQRDYEVFSFPSTIFLDADHNVSREWVGLIGESNLREQLEIIASS